MKVRYQMNRAEPKPAPGAKPEVIPGYEKDIVQLIKEDHSYFSKLYDSFKSERDTSEKQNLGWTIVRQLSLHSGAEEVALYPSLRTIFNDGNELADRCLKEHAEVKEKLYQLDNLKVDDPKYDPLMDEVIKETKQHITEEEQILDRLQRQTTKETLMSYGWRFIQAKKIAPTRPHPSAPDKPPFNIPANMGARVVDELRDATRTIDKEAPGPIDRVS